MGLWRGLNEFTHAKPERGPGATKHWEGETPARPGHPHHPWSPGLPAFWGPSQQPGSSGSDLGGGWAERRLPLGSATSPFSAGPNLHSSRPFKQGPPSYRACPVQGHTWNQTHGSLARPPGRHCLPGPSSPPPSRRVHTSAPQGHLRSCPLAIHPRLTNHQLESFICGIQRPTWGTSIFPGHWSDRCPLERQLRATARALGAGGGGGCVWVHVQGPREPSQ